MGQVAVWLEVCSEILWNVNGLYENNLKWWDLMIMLKLRSKLQKICGRIKLKSGMLLLLSLFLMICIAAPAQTAELSQAAADGFNRYAQLTEQDMHDQIRHGHFLWIDTLSASERDADYKQLRQGKILTQQQEMKDNGQEIKTPGAMIHDWVSVIFVPGVNLREVKVFFQDYNNMEKYYGPEVVRSKLLSRRGEHFKIYMRMYIKKILTLVVNTTNDIEYKQLDSKHLISISYATRIAEVANPGTPEEHELPVGKDHGLLWGSKSYWRAEEKDGGVYVQCETLTLTRDIPEGVKLLVKPFVTSAPKEFLGNMMTDVRKGAIAMVKAGSAEKLSG